VPFKVAAVSSHIKSKWSLSTLAKSIGYTQLARCTRLRLTWGKLILLLFHPTLLQTCSTPLLVSDSGSYLYVCCVAFFYFCWHRNWKWINCVSKVKVVGHFSGSAIIINCWCILETEGFIWNLLLKIVIVWSSDHWSFSPEVGKLEVCLGWKESFSYC